MRQRIPFRRVLRAGRRIDLGAVDAEALGGDGADLVEHIRGRLHGRGGSGFGSDQRKDVPAEIAGSIADDGNGARVGIEAAGWRCGPAASRRRCAPPGGRAVRRDRYARRRRSRDGHGPRARDRAGRAPPIAPDRGSPSRGTASAWRWPAARRRPASPLASCAGRCVASGGRMRASSSTKRATNAGSCFSRAHSSGVSARIQAPLAIRLAVVSWPPISSRAQRLRSSSRVSTPFASSTTSVLMMLSAGARRCCSIAASEDRHQPVEADARLGQQLRAAHAVAAKLASSASRA